MRKIYVDNAATNNFKPRNVIKTVIKNTKNQYNAGHGNNSCSIELSRKIWEVREKIASHYNLLNAENVVFTKNCTEALNVIIHGIKYDKEKDNVIASTFEHNSVLRPLYKLKQDGLITLTIANPENGKNITAKDISMLLNEKTCLVCVCSYSNVTGNKNDIAEIGKLCKNKNILFLVDDAQGAGHDKIDMISNNVNFLAFSGHKGYYSPQGVGALLINYDEKLLPIMQGGTGTNSEELLQPDNLPESLESGTIMSPAILALGKGIEYVEKNSKKISKRICDLSYYLIKELEIIDGIKVYSSNSIGIVAFSHSDIDSVKMSSHLDEKYQIITRSGLHCAPLTHKFLGTTKSGLVRISVNHKNTLRQMKYIIKCIRKSITELTEI